MKNTQFVLQKFEADEGFVFDWKEPRYHEEENENGEKVQVQEHLYARTLFLSVTDSIDNYIEVEAPVAE